VRLARTLGISYKRLKGWEPTTVYVYDGDRLVSSRPEAEWDETEQAWMAALGEYEKTLCGHCGLPREICEAPTAEWNVRVPAPTRCHVTTAIMRAQEALGDGVKQPGALKWGFTLGGLAETRAP
jgi:hypothetical protein